MSKRENDNIYKVGTHITAKDSPRVKLVIKKYIHRSYHCAIEDDTSRNYLRYLECDLIPPLQHLVL
jgi:hypothetical protein